MTAGTPDRRSRAGVLTRLAARRGPRSRGRRAVGTAVRMLIALFLVGGVYAGLAPSASAEDTPLSDAAKKGQAIYNQNCISCHGRNAEGVENRGPSLLGVGSAAVEFQVTTGRMPATRQEAQVERKD